MEGLTLLVDGTYVSFGCEEGFCAGSRSPLLVRGYHGLAGGQMDWWRLWGRVAGTFGATEVEAKRTMGLGVYASTGMQIPVGPVSLLPGLTYRWMGDVLALSGDFGVAYRLGGRAP